MFRMIARLGLCAACATAAPVGLLTAMTAEWAGDTTLACARGALALGCLLLLLPLLLGVDRFLREAAGPAVIPAAASPLRSDRPWQRHPRGPRR